MSQVLPIWNPRLLFLGGRNPKQVRLDLPDNVKLTPNIAGLLGGIALWHDVATPPTNHAH